MLTTPNRLGWTVEQWSFDFRVATRGGSDALGRGFPTEAEAETALATEITRRDRRNAKSRGRSALMTGLGLRRNLDGSWE